MITLDVLMFLGLLAAAHIGGFLLAVRVYGLPAHRRTVRCRRRDAAINDEAEASESL